ncbi:SRPBCC family protein [Nocardioides sp. J2M5]|uniref:SRPBCC family protein n=1 Tax=Nocardioides palaemonis TaxID=2829810 RepID=UPI001BA6A393|nr:SRPBCC family protein [Nocardioides palaemonis]MBS2938141.1 SRPBCC family protein [Nocardioides palaemonis]
MDLARATTAEAAASLPGDDLVDADVVMDRGLDLPAPPEEVWPWLVQLGKRRAGWYLPRAVERFVPSSRRALRRVDPALLAHEVGDVIPDWGGRDATFTLAAIEPPRLLLYTSRRGRTDLTWCLLLRPAGDGSRLHLRLRLGPVRRRRLAEVVGGAFDALTVAGMGAGLRERLQD